MTNISTYGQFLRIKTENLNLQRQLATLNNQVSTGKRAQEFGGLGVDARSSINLRGRLKELEAYQANISTAQIRIASMVEAMEQIKEVALHVRDAITSWSGDPSPDTTIINDVGRRAYDEVAHLLNIRVDGRYIFAGSDIANPPFPDSAQFYADIETAVSAWAVNGAAVTLGDTRAIAADTTQYFSAALQAADGSPPKVTVDEGVTVTFGVRANVTEAPDPTAEPQPYFREILRGLATVATLNFNDGDDRNEFEQIVERVRRNLDLAVRELNNQVGILGNTHSRLEEISQRHDDTALTAQRLLSDVEDVDMAEAITRLQLTQTQLQTSYQVTSSLSRINLVDFL